MDSPFTRWDLISKSTEAKKQANPLEPWHVTFNRKLNAIKEASK